MNKLVLIILFVIMMMAIHAQPSAWVPANSENTRWQIRQNEGFLEFRYNLNLTQLAVKKDAKKDSECLFSSKSNTITSATLWWDFKNVDCIITADAITAKVPTPEAGDYTFNLDIYVGDDQYFAYIDRFSPYATKPNNKNSDLHQAVRITETGQIIPLGDIQK